MIYITEQYCLWFMIYSVAGWVYESILCSLEEKRFINRGFLNGPYCPIYGVGAIIDIVCLSSIKNPVLLFFGGAALNCTLEYLTSYTMEKMFHARWWDYSDKKFNINGRICLIGAVVFGAFAAVLILFVQPALAKYTNMISPPIMHVLMLFILVFASDCVITLSAFSNFNTKLKEISALIEQRKESALQKLDKLRTEAASFSIGNASHDIMIKKLNFQHKRILRAFPRFRSLRYNDALKELRKQLRRKSKK